MNRKNIIILTNQDLSDYKEPIAPAFWQTINGYCDDGWRIFIVNANNHKISLYNYLDRYWYCEFIKSFAAAGKIRKIGKIFRYFSQKHLDKQFVEYTIPILKEVLERKEECIIYAYEVTAVSAGKYLSEKYHIPLVTRFQGTILYGRKNTVLNRLRYHPHFGALKTSADLVIMTDDGTHGKEVLEKIGNKSKRILFYKNGVEYCESAKVADIKGLSSDDKVLMTLSRLVSWKRVDRAIRCLPKVMEKYPNTKLVIVGYGEEKDNLIALTKSLSVESNVLFTGKVDHKDTFAYLKRADIFLSLYDLSNVGNPLLEAMRCSKPIITLDVGDTKSVIQNRQNGILLTLDRIDTLSEEIISLFDNAEYAKMLGRNAEKYAKEHFWTWNERIAAELNAVNRLIGIVERENEK